MTDCNDLACPIDRICDEKSHAQPGKRRWTGLLVNPPIPAVVREPIQSRKHDHPGRPARATAPRDLRRRIILHQSLEKPRVVRTDRQQLEDRVALLGHDNRRRLALDRIRSRFAFASWRSITFMSSVLRSNCNSRFLVVGTPNSPGQLRDISAASGVRIRMSAEVWAADSWRVRPARRADVGSGPGRASTRTIDLAIVLIEKPTAISGMNGNRGQPGAVGNRDNLSE